MTEQPIESRMTDERKIDYQFFFYKFFLKHWYLYLISLSIALLGAYYYNWYTTPLYNATSTILINDNKKSGNAQDLLAQMNNLDNQGGIDNEVEMIKSRSMISKTLRRLDFDVTYMLLGKIKKSELYKQSPLLLRYDSLSFLIYDQPIYVTVTDSNHYEISYTLKNSSETITANHLFDELVVDEMGKYRLEKSQRFSNAEFGDPDYEKRDFMMIINNFDKLIDQYSRNLKTEFVSKRATVLQLSLRDPVPQKAGDFLNMLMGVYLQSGIDQKNELASNTLTFIDDQLKTISADLDVSEKNLEHFKTEKGITDISTEAEAFLGSVKSYDDRISEINIQVSFLVYLEQYIQEDREIGKMSPASIGIADPLLAKLVTQLNDLQSQRKSQLNSTKPDNPIVVSLDIQIQNTKEDLLENVKSIKDGLNASKAQAESQLAQIQAKIRTVPGTQRELIGMERQATIRQGLYNYLLQKKAETAIMLASTISDNRVVDSARASYKPVTPVPGQSYTFALLLGLFIPISFLMLRENLTDKIKDIKEIENFAAIPVLGMVGYSDESSSLVVADRPESQIAEAFRSIRTNVQYIASEVKCKKILVTSSTASEGKSFCASNISAVYAISGKRVVLIGGDLRKPKKNEEFNLSHSAGVSNYLIGSCQLDDVIQHSTEVPNLDIILSGPKPPNPSELIMSDRMEKFMAELEQRYDIIIIDSPPVGLVTDGMLFSKFADLTLYVIRQNVTRRQHLEFIRNLNREQKLPRLGIIFNAVKAKSLYYGYGNGYGYGYGYYEEDRQKKKKKA